MPKRLAAFAASLAIVLLPICLPYAVHAQGNFGLDQTVNAVNSGQQRPIFQTGSAGTPEALIGQIIKNILAFTGVVFFLLMIYAGILWMTAQGDEKKVSQAKDTIKAAVIGIFVIGAAYALTSFVLTAVTGGPPSGTGGTGQQ